MNNSKIFLSLFFISLLTTSHISSAARLSVLFGGSGSGSSGKAYARAFVTSTKYDGNLGGIAGADAKCQARADAVSLGGTWKAIISDSTTNAYGRMKFRTKSVYDLAGRLLWNPSQGIVSSNDTYTTFYPSPFSSPQAATPHNGPILAVRLNTTELGGTSSTATWTGTDYNGAAQPGNCANWTSTVSSGYIGHTDYITASWINYSTANCNTTTQALICLEDE